MAKAKSTCSVEGCEKIVNARGWCSWHYQQWKKKNPRKCRACGGSMAGRAPRALYCSDECRKCSAEGCDHPSAARGLCITHYGRVARGLPLVHRCETCETPIDPARRFCSEDCKPRCAFGGCGRPYRYSDGYCVKHGAMTRSHGSPIGAFEWREKADEYECLTCKVTFYPNGYSRRYCSPRCARTFFFHKGEVPSLDFHCGMCGIEVNRDRKGNLGHRLDRKLCADCRRSRRQRHKSSPLELANRDGKDCGICGEVVDLKLRHPDPMSGSVDHIIPVALGGAVRDKQNLQLSHLSCNLSKQARLERPAQMALEF